MDSAPSSQGIIAPLTFEPAAEHKAASGDPGTAASRVAAATHRFGATVKNLDQQTAQTVSSITTVDLAGISHIEEAFAIALAAAAMALFVVTAIAERRHELATMAAVGSSIREISAFVWSEAALVLGGALVLAAGLGLLLALMLVAMLTHVFDPPPDHLAIPWGFIAALAGAALAAAVAASALAERQLDRLPLGAILRER